MTNQALCLALAALSMVLFFSNRAMLQGMTTAMEQLAEIEERRAATADFSALEELHTRHLQQSQVWMTDPLGRADTFHLFINGVVQIRLIS